MCFLAAPCKRQYEVYEKKLVSDSLSVYGVVGAERGACAYPRSFGK